ncbi:unnamed protein product [Fraxinus pennsylvanica]|uniref:SHSP domain-containing protein n=1 Tax=Fraxinus pennsylvanica TaxID=56036 RepID=A0AAD1ZLC4_9LAMI|nr:unnamed protein product [Fraxinus pennsylvanica]
MEVALRNIGFDAPMLVALHDMLDFVDDAEKPHHPSRAYIWHLLMMHKINLITMKKFVLPEKANLDKICAVCQDGVLTVTMEKKPQPEPKVIEVKWAAHGGGGEGSHEVKTSHGTDESHGDRVQQQEA